MDIYLKINEKQAKTIQQALELYARIGMGQLHDVEFHAAFESRDYDRSTVDKLLDEVKHNVFQDLYGRGHSYGIRNEKTHEASKEAYDMYQVLRNTLAWHHNPKGNTWSNLYDEPVQFSLQPLITCEIEESEY